MIIDQDVILCTATEIQNIQIGEGNACTNLAIPIYMIFPRLFTCPTLSTSNFKVGKKIVVSDTSVTFTKM